MAYGWSPEEPHFQHPRLSIGQIHSALAYYCDHQDQINPQIAQKKQFADLIPTKAGPWPLRARLKAKGLR